MPSCAVGRGGFRTPRAAADRGMRHAQVPNLMGYEQPATLLQPRMQLDLKLEGVKVALTRQAVFAGPPLKFFEW